MSLMHFRLGVKMYYLDYEQSIFVCGDFNINLLTRTCYSEKMLRVINDLPLKQIVKEPTRVTKESKTLIDYVLTKNYDQRADVLLDDKITDHSTISFCINGDKPVRRSEVIVERVHNSFQRTIR